MGKRIRLGIIGTSGWTETMYLKALRDLPGVELAAICGRNAARSSDLAAMYGIDSTYTDHQEMIAKGNLDAIIVASPDDLHLPMTLAAIEAGLDVLCEKPLANSAADSHRILVAAEAARIKHMVMFTWRWRPHYQFVKSLLDEGAFGTVYRAHFSFITDFAMDSTYQWRLDPKRANGVLGDLGSHMIDLGRWMFGEVASVSADLGTAVSRAGIAGHENGSNNDHAHLTLHFEGGVHGVVDVTVVSRNADRLVRHVLRIEGETAALEVDDVFTGTQAGTSLRWLAAGERQSRLLEIPQRFLGSSGRADIFEFYANEPVGGRGFIAAILEGKQPSPDFSDGWRAQQVVDAALQSHRERRWVDIS